ncbi:hypothetical protein GRJ2_000382200 [Grus japonensis]|uniref:Uncharacterized protein n=1 Tax=Grus japonensis TaxID=30415 RepID=A0ABC9W2U2_GRUJA
MEDPTPEQVEAPEGGCGLWEAHAGASSRPDRWTREEGSPRQGRFAGRTRDPVGDPTLEQFAPEAMILVPRPVSLVFWTRHLQRNVVPMFLDLTKTLLSNSELTLAPGFAKKNQWVQCFLVGMRDNRTR